MNGEEPGPPHRLSELRVWLLGGDELHAATSELCKVEGAPLEGRLDPNRRPPHLLLVEVDADPRREWMEHHDALLARCKATGTPSILLVAASPCPNAFLSRCGRFDRVLTVDPSQLEGLEAAGARHPAPTHFATSFKSEATAGSGASERPDPVVWLGSWDERWPRAWREKLAEVLRAAAEFGLKIFPWPAGDGASSLDALPADLRRHVEGPPATDRRTRRRLLESARVVIGADPAIPSRYVAPSIVFDAIACGAAAVTPHDVGIATTGLWFSPPPDRPEAAELRRNLVPVVRDRDSASREIGGLLADPGLREKTVAHARRIVAFNHTYANRVATIASSVGYRLAPDGA